jgi:ribosomal protein S15P/S13E
MPNEGQKAGSSKNSHQLETAITDLHEQINSLTRSITKLTEHVMEDAKEVKRRLAKLHEELGTVERLLPGSRNSGKRLIEETRKLNLHEEGDKTEKKGPSRKRPATDERMLASGRKVVIRSVIGAVRAGQDSKPPTKPCLFCEHVGHWSNTCPTYSTYKQREARASELGVCSRCMASGHEPDGGVSCDHEILAKKCHHCGNTGHHQLVCPNEFPDDEEVD